MHVFRRHVTRTLLVVTYCGMLAVVAGWLYAQRNLVYVTMCIMPANGVIDIKVDRDSLAIRNTPEMANERFIKVYTRPVDPRRTEWTWLDRPGNERFCTRVLPGVRLYVVYSYLRSWLIAKHSTVLAYLALTWLGLKFVHRQVGFSVKS